MHSPSVGGSLLSPLLVALGAFLWSTDALFRFHVIHSYDPITIVFYNHVLSLAIAGPICVFRWREVLALSKREWIAILVLTIGGSVVAMTLFTMAFALSKNVSVPMLIQKVQPVVAVGLSVAILKETLLPKFWLWAFLAGLGVYLISFELIHPLEILESADFTPVMLSLGAAVVWAACTIAGRVLLKNRDYLFVTSLRFTIASVILALIVWFEGQSGHALAPIPPGDLPAFAGMAVLSGWIALLIYYAGLRGTPASVATLCELTFPLGAIVVNWMFLNATLSGVQIFGSALLLIAVTALSLANAHSR